MKPPVIVCERCDTLARHWRTVGDKWLCEACIRAVDDHTRWCACGLLLAGSTRQILAMCEVHWRTCGTWQLLTYDPRREESADHAENPHDQAVVLGLG